MVVARMHGRWLAAVLLTLSLAACGQAGVEFTVRNVGAVALDSAVIHTTGYSYAVGDVPAGASRTVWVSATAESHIEVEHGTDGRTRLVVDTYFEPGYAGTVMAEVRSDSVLRVEAQVR